jgi:polyhydroxyalkanoate synthesis regulator phasin
MIDLESQMQNYNKVKELVLSKLVDDGLLDQDDANEFSDRCQVLIYKGKWFSKWFDKNMKTETNTSDQYFIRMIEMREKEDEVDRLLRRTTGNYNDNDDDEE